MPRLTPIARDDLIRRLREFGFVGPNPRSKHAMMERGSAFVPIPNPHGSVIGVDLLARILRQAGISRDEWVGGEPNTDR